MALTIEEERVLVIEANKLLKAEQAKVIRETYQTQISAKQVEIGNLEKARDSEITALNIEEVAK